VKSRHRTGYEIDRFLAFYKRGLDYILSLNKQGVDLQEVYAKIILTKILTPYSTGYVDLQSPAGAGVSVLVYNYDGDVYASDEARMLAEMHDTTFRLGNVHSDSHRSIFTGIPSATWWRHLVTRRSVRSNLTVAQILCFITPLKVTRSGIVPPVSSATRTWR